MTPSSLFLAALLLLAGALLIPPALSQNCKSPKPASRYAHCTELPTLNATLHYTAANSTLSFFFASKPESSSGWVAWGVNPTGTAGMYGAFAFLAFKNSSSGNIAVNTYYLTKTITQQKMPWPVENLTAVAESGGGISISATMIDLPKNMSRKVNHLWQKGLVQTQIPQAHSFKPENLNSKATLELSTGKSAAPAASPAAAPPSGAGNNSTIPTSPASVQSPTGTDAGGSSANRKTNWILYALLVSVAGLLAI